MHCNNRRRMKVSFILFGNVLVTQNLRGQIWAETEQYPSLKFLFQPWSHVYVRTVSGKGQPEGRGPHVLRAASTEPWIQLREHRAPEIVVKWGFLGSWGQELPTQSTCPGLGAWAAGAGWRTISLCLTVFICFKG